MRAQRSPILMSLHVHAFISTSTRAALGAGVSGARILGRQRVMGGAGEDFGIMVSKDVSNMPFSDTRNPHAASAQQYLHHSGLIPLDSAKRRPPICKVVKRKLYLSSNE